MDKQQQLKSSKSMLTACASVFAMAVGLAPGSVAAADDATYPNKPITLIVAFAAGGGSDLVVRLLAPYIEKELGNNARIVVSNKPGAGGAIGFSELARSAPDGYTIGLINTPNVLTIPIERKSAFTWRSFDLLGNIVDDPANFPCTRAARSSRCRIWHDRQRPVRASSVSELPAQDRTITWRCCCSRRMPMCS
jgi:tripartite-type tricarboxylate transporter receptor subunit TctC